MHFHHHQLKNGLDVVAECNPEVHSSGIGFFVRAGSRDESDEVAGVSHFLEHMVFKGTPSRTADDVNREFDEMGAHYNAFTTEESTVYYAAVLPECQDRTVALLADILRPSLREEDFQTEKQVILEEIQMYEDQPPYCADDKCKELFFAEHPLARSVLGTQETITALTAAQMRDYFRRRYAPGNITLAAAGRVDFDGLVREAERLCGGWESVEAPRDTGRASGRAACELLYRPSSTQQYVLQMASGPAATDDDRLAAKLLATVVGDDSGSRFYWELVDSGRSENASLNHYEYEGSGVFMGYMNCDPRGAADNLDRMQQIYLDVERQGVTPDELTQAKSKLKSRIVLSSERPRNRLFTVGGNWTHRHAYRSVKTDLDDIAAVTLEEIQGVLDRYPLSVNATLTIGPLERMSPCD